VGVEAEDKRQARNVMSKEKGSTMHGGVKELQCMSKYCAKQYRKTIERSLSL